jgi:anti-sigma factor RsiW
MNAGERRIPETILECYLAGSLDKEARAEVEALLMESGVDRARLVELQSELAEFLMQHPSGPRVEHDHASSQVLSSGARRIPETLLECYLAGSLNDEARAEVESLLMESAADRARLAQLQAESVEFSRRPLEDSRQREPGSGNDPSPQSSRLTPLPGSAKVNEALETAFKADVPQEKLNKHDSHPDKVPLRKLGRK